MNDSRLHKTQARVQERARRVSPAGRRARDISTQRIMDAREWSAPRLEQAGTYVEKRLGPRIGALLSTTAGKVRPARPRRSRWVTATSLLALGGALGTAGAIVTRRSSARSGEPHVEASAGHGTEADSGTEEHAHTS